MRHSLAYYVILLFYFGVESSRISTQSYAYGPGLRAEFDVPVRYFFIQAVSEEGEHLDRFDGENPFSIKFHRGDNSRISYMNKILNLKNGTFLVFVNNEELAQSPLLLNNPVKHPGCNCPISSTEWKSDLSCPNYSFNGTSLDNFPKIKLKGLADRIFTKFPHASLVHYTVKENRIYRKTFGRYTDFKMFSDEILLYLTRKTRLPDMEFFMNLGDWPQEKDKKAQLPIISWCGQNDHFDIILPTYDITRATLDGLYRQELDVLMTYGHVGPPWKEKMHRALFRGRDSRQERLDLVEQRRKRTDRYDLGLTHFFFFKHDENKYGKIAQRIGFFEFFNYRYQLNLDGTVAAYRFPYLISGTSLVLKQESDYYEHFYRFLRPWEHYVPFSTDLDELDRLLDWAESNEEEVETIVSSARRVTEEYLFPDKILCYIVMLFEEYASRLGGKVTVYPDMELVEQSQDICSICETPRDEL